MTCEPVLTIFPKDLWFFEHFRKYGCFFPFKLTISYLGAKASRIGVPLSHRTSCHFLNGSRFRSTCFLSNGWTFFAKIQQAMKNFNLHCCKLDVKEKSNRLRNPRSWRKSLAETSLTESACEDYKIQPNRLQSSWNSKELMMKYPDILILVAVGIWTTKATTGWSKTCTSSMVVLSAVTANSP